MVGEEGQVPSRGGAGVAPRGPVQPGLVPGEDLRERDHARAGVGRLLGSLGEPGVASVGGPGGQAEQVSGQGVGLGVGDQVGLVGQGDGDDEFRRALAFILAKSTTRLEAAE